MDALVGLVAGSLLADPLKRAWSAIAQLIWEGRVRRIQGLWDSTYSDVSDKGKPVQHKDAIRLTQFGVYISGKNEGRTDQSYEMKGHFPHQTLITGTWKSVRPEVTYHGTFQLVVAADGKTMSGKWLGNSNSGNIRSGDWVWHRRA